MVGGESMGKSYGKVPRRADDGLLGFVAFAAPLAQREALGFLFFFLHCGRVESGVGVRRMTGGARVVLEVLVVLWGCCARELLVRPLTSSSHVRFEMVNLPVSSN